MVWGAIATAGVGLVSGLIGGQQQRSAADAANKEQDKIAEAQYERDTKEWELNYAQSLSDYAWSLANTEAQRYQDRVKKADYEAQQGRIIDAAVLNLELNSQALMDQYIVSEKLRATQVTNELQDNLAAEQVTYDDTMMRIGNDARSAILSSTRDVEAYMNSVKTRGLQADALLSKKQNEGQAIQEQIVIGEQLDTLQRDAQYITALVEGADQKAGSLARQGGSNSSRRVAMDSMKAFGRSYGLLKTEQKNRRRQLNNYNASLSGESASEMAQIAAGIEREANAIKYTKGSTAITMDSLRGQATTALGKYQLQTGSLMRNFNQLTKPGFALAQRQGQREYTALLEGAKSTIAAASTPYREAIIFDPLEPIAGLKPEKMLTTKVAKPSWGSILAGSAVQAAQGAMSMSYTNAAGNLAFR